MKKDGSRLLIGFIAGALTALLLGTGVLALLRLGPFEEASYDMYDFYNVNNGLGFDYLLTYGLTDEDGIRALDDVWLKDETLEEANRSHICTPDGEPVTLPESDSSYYFTVTYPLPEGDVTLVFRDRGANGLPIVGILQNG